MDLATILKNVRGWLDDEVGPDTEKLWSDLELTEYANDVIEELCDEVDLIKDSTTAADGDSNPVCTITLIEDQGTYDLHPSINKVIRAKISSETKPLTPATVEGLDVAYPGWEDESGVPQYFIVEPEDGKIRLSYAPNADIAGETLDLTVYRMPLVELDATDALDDVPEINAKYHRKLTPGILARAYRKKDSETRNEKLEKLYEQAWQANIEKIKIANLRLRRVPKTVSPRGAFK